jgi:undecaprenyl diphosphate synthase
MIMDGNGRWARARTLPRHAGHRAGAKTVRTIVGGQALTLFAFSSENWQRPKEEVGLLMSLFLEALDREVADLHRNGIRVRFIGNRKILSQALQERIVSAEEKTGRNQRMQLLVAVAYGGRWDLAQAVRTLAQRCADGELLPAQIDEALISEGLELADVGDPDLFIRTGGEHRISNFLLWNLAYTELYFTDTLWPDFDDQQLARAFDYFAGRERRYGLTPAQVDKREC